MTRKITIEDLSVNTELSADELAAKQGGRFGHTYGYNSTSAALRASQMFTNRANVNPYSTQRYQVSPYSTARFNVNPYSANRYSFYR